MRRLFGNRAGSSSQEADRGSSPVRLRALAKSGALGGEKPEKRAREIDCQDREPSMTNGGQLTACRVSGKRRASWERIPLIGGSADGV